MRVMLFPIHHDASPNLQPERLGLSPPCRDYVLCPLCKSRVSNVPVSLYVPPGTFGWSLLFNHMRLLPPAFWDHPPVRQLLNSLVPPPPPTPTLTLDDLLVSPSHVVFTSVVAFLVRSSTLTFVSSGDYISEVRSIHAAYAVPADCATSCSHLSGVNHIPVVRAAWNSSRLGVRGPPGGTTVLLTDRFGSDSLSLYPWGA